MQHILPDALALSMGLGLTVLSDRLLEPMELDSYVGTTVTEAKAMNWPYTFFI